MQEVQDLALLALVLDGIEADEGMVIKQAQHTVRMVDYLVGGVASLESHRTVRNRAELVPLSYERFDDFGTAALRSGDEEAPGAVVEHDRAFALERQTLIFEVCQVDHMFEFRLEFSDNLRASLVAPGAILHRVDNEHAAGDSIALIAGEPVREYSVRCILARLRQNSDRDAGASDI